MREACLKQTILFVRHTKSVSVRVRHCVEKSEVVLVDTYGHCIGRNNTFSIFRWIGTSAKIVTLRNVKPCTLDFAQSSKFTANRRNTALSESRLALSAPTYACIAPFGQLVADSHGFSSDQKLHHSTSPLLPYCCARLLSMHSGRPW